MVRRGRDCRFLVIVFSEEKKKANDLGICHRSLNKKASKKHSKEYTKARARYPSPPSF